MRIWWLFPVLTLTLACGKEDSSGFIALDKVCAAYAEIACQAQQRCCDGEQDAPACETRVRAACESERDELLDESSLRFDGEHARNELDALAAELDACTTLPPLASVFQGGKGLEASCERDAECTSFVCEASCQAPALAPLCDL